MPNPDDFRFQQLPKEKFQGTLGGLPEVEIRLSADAEMALRVQLLEKEILRNPISAFFYMQALAKAGLEPMKLYF